jgi:hypothetical protein
VFSSDPSWFPLLIWLFCLLGFGGIVVLVVFAWYASKPPSMDRFLERLKVYLDWRSPAVTLRTYPRVVLFLLFGGVIGLCGMLYWLLYGGADEVPHVPQVSVGETAAVIEVEAPTPTPTATATPTPIPSPIEIILGSGLFSEEQKAQISLAYLLDPEGDWIYSIAMQAITNPLDQTDIQGHVGARLGMTQEVVDQIFNQTEFPCGGVVEGGFVVCAAGEGPLPAGEVVMVVIKLAAEIPATDPDHFYTYAAVFDADGDPVNNFRFQAPYDWDYWQNTDRWYALDWNPSQQVWNLNVTDVAKQQFAAPSAARTVMLGDIVVFFIPSEELPAESLGYRVSAFGHDGTYQLEVSSGDVSGADPTEPLTEIDAEVIEVVAPGSE